MNPLFTHVLEPGIEDQIREICRSTGFFREDETEVAAELALEALAKGQQDSGYYFLLAWHQQQLCAFACFGPTPCTVSTWDLYWIVVSNTYQGKGIGKEMLQSIEQSIRELGGRKLYIETSSQEKYLPTRNFYLKSNYNQEARLSDFYDTGDDKIIYARYL